MAVILKNGRKQYCIPAFFSGDIANVIPMSALNKIVPLMKISGVARWQILAHGQMRKYTWTMNAFPLF